MKAVIFDVGGVLVRGGLFSFMRKAYAVLGKEFTFIPPEVEVIPRDFFIGKMDPRDAFTHALGEMTDSQYGEVLELWMNTWKVEENVLEVVSQLKESGFKLGVLSNSDPVNFPKYMDEGLFDMFDVMVFSHEVGMLKPDKRIYELVVEKLGVSAADCVYVDDQERMLEPAKELGMNVIHYREIVDLATLTKVK